MIAAGADVNAKDADGFAPLHGAACKGRIASVKALIAAGADVNAKDTNGFTPLHWAACERVDCISKGAYCCRRRCEMRRILMALHRFIRAAGSGHSEVVERLIAAGADASAKSPTGSTALLYAADAGHYSAGKGAYCCRI